MLKFLRNKANQKKIFFLITLIVVPSFIIWGIIVDKTEGQVGPVAGVLGRTKITTGEFIKNYQAVRRQVMLFQTGLGSRLDNTALERATWDRILLLRYAKKHGFRTSSKEVIEWVARQPAFTIGGRMDPKLYRRFVEREFRITPREFEEEIRSFLTIQKVVSSFLKQVSVADEESAKKEYGERFAKRDLRYVLLTGESKDATRLEEEALSLRNAMLEKGFDAASAEKNIPIGEAKAVRFFEPLGEAGSLENFLDKLMPLQPGEISPPLVLSEGVLLIQIQSIDPDIESEWTSQKENFLRALRQREEVRLLEERLQELWKDLKINHETMAALFPFTPTSKASE